MDRSTIDDRRGLIAKLLRGAESAMTAEEISRAVGFDVRTIYRDIAAMKLCGSPIIGERGVGYVMRRK